MISLKIKITLIWGIYFLVSTLLMIVLFVTDLGFNIIFSIFLIFTLLILIILAFFLAVERVEEIKRIIQLNPNLSIDKLSKKSKAPKEWVESILSELESVKNKETFVDLKKNKTKLKIFRYLILIIIIAIILLGILNMYKYSQIDIDSADFRFWGLFFVTSLILIFGGLKVSDMIEKRKIYPKEESFSHRVRNFRVQNIDVFSIPRIGFYLLSILLLIFFYMFLLIPYDYLEQFFEYNSPIFIIFIILGTSSIILIILGFILGFKKNIEN